MKSFLKVKLLIIGLILYQLPSPMIYSQEKVESLKPKSIEAISTYWNTLDSLTDKANDRISKVSENSKPSFLENIDLVKLKQIARIMYNAYDNDYISIQNSISAKSQALREKDPKDNQSLLPPGFIEHKILERIKNSISNTVYGLERVAYLLKIKVTNVKTVVPTDEGVIHGHVTVVNGIIENVYKGNTIYIIGDNISFYFYDFWESNGLHKYEIGKEYLVPLDPRDKFLGFDPALALVPYLDNSNGYHPIIDGYLIDKYNFFGFGDKVDYNTFDQKLKNKIEEIKSW